MHRKKLERENGFLNTQIRIMNHQANLQTLHNNRLRKLKMVLDHTFDKSVAMMTMIQQQTLSRQAKSSYKLKRTLLVLISNKS